jgi:hypothetical protein
MLVAQDDRAKGPGLLVYTHDQQQITVGERAMSDLIQATATGLRGLSDTVPRRPQRASPRPFWCPFSPRRAPPSWLGMPPRALVAPPSSSLSPLFLVCERPYPSVIDCSPSIAVTYPSNSLFYSTPLPFRVA